MTRKGHYIWKPVDLGDINLNVGRGQLGNTIAWTPILPAGAEVKQTNLPGNDRMVTLELNVHDIPPAPEEDFMPPIGSFTYRVLFYYSAYRTAEEFWKNEGQILVQVVGQVHRPWA